MSEIRCTKGRALAEVRTFTYTSASRFPDNIPASLAACAAHQTHSLAQSDPDFTHRVARDRRYTPQPYCRQVQSLLAIVGVGHGPRATSDLTHHFARAFNFAHDVCLVSTCSHCYLARVAVTSERCAVTHVKRANSLDICSLP